MLRTQSEIVIIGGGSAGLALAYHYALQDHKDRDITILESRATYRDDRTWCFWDFDELVPSLRPIIRQKWNRWSFSHDTETVVQRSTVHPYCSISAGNYYDIVLNSIAAEKNIALIADCHVLHASMKNNDHVLSTTKGEITCKHIIDTRPPVFGYAYSQTSSCQAPLPEKIPGTPLYQIFFGIEVTVEKDIFDPATVQLMADMTHDEHGLQFMYVLPFSAKQALIEYTCFTSLLFTPEKLRQKCLQKVQQMVQEAPYQIVREEGAFLPLGLPKREGGKQNWIYAGIPGGSLRKSTGYAFIRTQRWAKRCAAALVKGDKPIPMHCDTTLREYLDNIFLQVMETYPELSTEIFMTMGKHLSADTFARFMMEKSTLRDYVRVISAMPAAPFLNQALKRLRGLAGNEQHN